MTNPYQIVGAGAPNIPSQVDPITRDRINQGISHFVEDQILKLSRRPAACDCTCSKTKKTLFVALELAYGLGSILTNHFFLNEYGSGGHAKIPEAARQIFGIAFEVATGLVSLESAIHAAHAIITPLDLCPDKIDILKKIVIFSGAYIMGSAALSAKLLKVAKYNQSMIVKSVLLYDVANVGPKLVAVVCGGKAAYHKLRDQTNQESIGNHTRREWTELVEGALHAMQFRDVSIQFSNKIITDLPFFFSDQTDHIKKLWDTLQQLKNTCIQSNSAETAGSTIGGFALLSTIVSEERGFYTYIPTILGSSFLSILSGTVAGWFPVKYSQWGMRTVYDWFNHKAVFGPGEGKLCSVLRGFSATTLTLALLTAVTGGIGPSLATVSAFGASDDTLYLLSGLLALANTASTIGAVRSLTHRFFRFVGHYCENEEGKKALEARSSLEHLYDLLIHAPEDSLGSNYTPSQFIKATIDTSDKHYKPDTPPDQTPFATPTGTAYSSFQPTTNINIPGTSQNDQDEFHDASTYDELHDDEDGMEFSGGSVFYDAHENPKSSASTSSTQGDNNI